MAIYNINKNANLEVENNLIRYRSPLVDYPTEDIQEIEKDMKRKAKDINQSPYYLTPFRAEIINSSVVYYYDVKNLKTFLSLRGLSFEEKLKYYSGMIEIAKNDDVKVMWDKYNFVVDPFEENVKAILYETEFITLHENTDPLKGLKELILMTLTTLDSILGKPRRSSFIDQEDKIISFAETIWLKIDNIDDLEDYIKTVSIEYEYENQAQDQSEKKGFIKLRETPEKKGGLANALKSRKTNSNTSKARSNTKKSSKNNKVQNKNLVMYGGLGLLLAVGILLNMLPDGGTGATTTDKKSADKKEPVSEQASLVQEDSAIEVETIGQTEYDEQLLLAYRYSQIEENEKAINVLEEIGYNNLEDADQNIMLKIYEDMGEYEQSIALEPSRAEVIVNDLITEKETQKIIDIQGKLETSNPYIDFEVAYLNGEMSKVIELQDGVNLNGRKETQITEAYLKLGEKDKARKFAEQVGNPDLMQMVQSYN